MKKHACIICGHLTLTTRTDWEICPVCYWEDDVPYGGVDKHSPANAMSIQHAQDNYRRHHACDVKYIGSVRDPLDDEPIDPNWKPIQHCKE